MHGHKFSPQQVAGKLRTTNILGYDCTYVCQEMIYNAIYTLPVGELCKNKRCMEQFSQVLHSESAIALFRRIYKDRNDVERLAVSLATPL